MSTDTLAAIDLSKLADAALSASQHEYLDSLPELLRGRAYSRVRAALRISAQAQLAYCSLGINQTALERLVNTERDRLMVEQAHGDFVTRLIQGGAPLPMLHTLLGMDKAEFVGLRKGLGITASPSRKPVDEEESVRIYRLWEQMGKPTDAAGFLHLHEVCGQPIQVLWGLVQDWQYAHQQRGTAKRKLRGG